PRPDRRVDSTVRMRNERAAREQDSVKAGPGYAPADSLRVPDREPVKRAAMTVGDLKVLPESGNARIDGERGTPLPEAENRLEARTVEPARGPGVPRPSPASHVGRFGIDVCGHGVRLDLVQVNVRATACMMDGVQ